MGREVTEHVVVGQPQRVRVETADDPNEHGYHCRYDCYLFKDNQWQKQNRVQFQEGPVKILDDKGKVVRESVTGITNEALLALLLDRCRGFQEGPFKCRENALVITKLEEALHWMQARTNERIKRGVKGTGQV